MCNLLNYGNRKLCPIVLLSLDVPLKCEKYLALEFLLKIDLWLYVAKDASVHYPRCFSAKWNNVPVQWLCTQRVSTSSLQTPTHLQRSLCPIPTKKSDLDVRHYVRIQRYAGKSVHLRESCLGEDCLRRKCTQLLSLSVSIMWDLKLLYLVYSTVKITTAAPSLLWKYLRKHLCSSKSAMCCGDACACLSNQMPTLDGCSEMSLLCCFPLSNWVSIVLLLSFLQETWTDVQLKMNCFRLEGNSQQASVISRVPADTWVSEAVVGLSWHFIIDK